MAIVKTFTVLSVSGDINRESVQRIMDEQNARDPRVNPLGIDKEDPTKNLMGNVHDKSGWPQATCDGLIVAVSDEEDGRNDSTRLELHVRDFAQLEGITTGSKVRLTVEPVA